MESNELVKIAMGKDALLKKAAKGNILSQPEIEKEVLNSPGRLYNKAFIKKRTSMLDKQIKNNAPNIKTNIFSKWKNVPGKTKFKALGGIGLAALAGGAIMGATKNPSKNSVRLNDNRYR